MRFVPWPTAAREAVGSPCPESEARSKGDTGRTPCPKARGPTSDLSILADLGSDSCRQGRIRFSSWLLRPPRIRRLSSGMEFGGHSGEDTRRTHTSSPGRGAGSALLEPTAEHALDVAKGWGDISELFGLEAAIGILRDTI